MSNRPINHNLPWTAKEDARLLAEWATKTLTVGEQKVIAKSMGRTYETCRTRVTQIKRLNGIDMRAETTRPRVADKPYLGVMDDPEDCWWL